MKILNVMAVAMVPFVVCARTKRGNDLPEVVRPEIARAAVRVAALPHPRLFGDAARFESMKMRLAMDEWLRMGAEHVRDLADGMAGTESPKRVKEGRRLLGVCRKALYRINTLAMAYRLYGRKEHLDQAVADLRAVCAFEDWNPSHFLDVAEMSLAVATGYDWLYQDLDPAVREEIATGLRRHGLDAGRLPEWWIRSGNNWGQVCHAGILSAALALAEPAQADDTGRFIQRCVDFLPCSMKALAPNGNYPEGPGYWSYGVDFNVVAMTLLEETVGSAFGLMDQPGFRETAEYPDLVTGPSGMTFNYADGGSGRGSCYALWWFARRLKRPDLLAYCELEAYRKVCTDVQVRKGKRRPRHTGDRLFAYSLFCVETPPPDLVTKAPLVWNAGGPVPIVIQRSSWDRAKMTFVGLKGGSPSSNHGHMDAGSFVLEAKGVRWAVDLGAENYNKIEQLGMNLWSAAQDSDRWKIFRLNAASHNILTIDGCNQRAKGFGRFLDVAASASGSSATVDLSDLYTNATTVVRTGSMT
ncbi:MAG: heparinase II/III family protein, partial [Kiritimatiellia bacterium]